MSSKEPLKTTTLIGWMWKCGDAWSWPVLIAREAWLYNAQAAVYHASIDSIFIKMTWFRIQLVRQYSTQIYLLITHLTKQRHWKDKTKCKVITVVLATIARVNHLIPSRTQKWNLLALMVVWGYPCESKSSPAHYSKPPLLIRMRGFFFVGIKHDVVGWLTIGEKI